MFYFGTHCFPEVYVIETKGVTFLIWFYRTRVQTNGGLARGCQDKSTKDCKYLFDLRDLAVTNIFF